MSSPTKITIVSQQPTMIIFKDHIARLWPIKFYLILPLVFLNCALVGCPSLNIIKHPNCYHIYQDIVIMLRGCRFHVYNVYVILGVQRMLHI